VSGHALEVRQSLLVRSYDIREKRKWQFQLSNFQLPTALPTSNRVCRLILDPDPDDAI